MASLPHDLVAALSDRYAIEREIGAGGMATVYLAHDIRHQRRVALKLLDPELAAVLGVARFLSEIQITANLQHPNLLPLFDSGEAQGLLFYVMPFVDGESLRARLDREKQLPVDDVLRITTAIASALDYAHRHGVIHRDLKPENILLHEGQPLVADFGIALAVSNAAGNRITQTGLSLGTPQYMSPEQATGDRVIDARTDIYSIGAVAYEMFTGDPPHFATTAQAIVAKILTEEPRSMRATRPSVPEHVDAAIMCALAKLPADRFATVKEFADALNGTRVGPALRRSGTSAVRVPRRRMQIVLRATPWAIALAAIAFAARPRPLPPDTPVARFSIALPSDARMDSRPAIAVSPDGGTIVYRSSGLGKPQLFARRLNDVHPRAIAGTEGAAQPFFSPDGAWLGFSSNGRIMKLPIGGGAPSMVTRVPTNGAVCTWGVDDIIICGSAAGLVKVSAAGGDISLLTRVDSAAGERAHRTPRFLSDGRTLVLTVVSKEPGVTHVAFARLDGRVSVTPVLGTAAAEIGHDILIYVGPDGGLMASRIDERARRMIPGAIALGETPSHVPGAILTSWNASRSGTLAYANAFATNQVMYVDRSGAAVPAIDELASFRRVRVSPDGTRLALEKFDGDADIWLYTIPSRTLTRLTTTGRNSDPLWTADGKRIAFTTSLEGVRGRFIASRAADGSGVMDTIVGNDASLASKYAASWSHDGGAIVFEEFTGVVPARLSMMRAGERPTVVVSSGDGPRRMGAVSPDGHWIAYVAGDEGVTDVYVSPFPGPGGRYQVSDHGGSQPVWAHNGRELFYRDRASVVAATVATAADFHVTDRKALFKDSYLNSNVLQWDVMPDDRHFVMIRPDEAGVQMTVVTNWLRELNAKLPPR